MAGQTPALQQITGRVQKNHIILRKTQYLINTLYILVLVVLYTVYLLITPVVTLIVLAYFFFRPPPSLISQYISLTLAPSTKQYLCVLTKNCFAIFIWLSWNSKQEKTN